MRRACDVDCSRCLPLVIRSASPPLPPPPARRIAATSKASRHEKRLSRPPPPTSGSDPVERAMAPISSQPPMLQHTCRGRSFIDGQSKRSCHAWPGAEDHHLHPDKGSKLPDAGPAALGSEEGGWWAVRPVSWEGRGGCGIALPLFRIERDPASTSGLSPCVRGTILLPSGGRRGRTRRSRVYPTGGTKSA